LSLLNFSLSENNNIVGSGLGGLSAAFFLIRDGDMPTQNITFFKEADITVVP
jgi:myosin-crossreactive antigen